MFSSDARVALLISLFIVFCLYATAYWRLIDQIGVIDERDVRLNWVLLYSGSVSFHCELNTSSPYQITDHEQLDILNDALNSPQAIILSPILNSLMTNTSSPEITFNGNVFPSNSSLNWLNSLVNMSSRRSQSHDFYSGRWINRSTLKSQGVQCWRALAKLSRNLISCVFWMSDYLWNFLVVQRKNYENLSNVRFTSVSITDSVRGSEHM